VIEDTTKILASSREQVFRNELSSQQQSGAANKIPHGETLPRS
jgi:hypothetical protein